jgi:hypothetical protein
MTARLSLSPLQIESLPPGAVYQAKSGNASAAVAKTDDGNIEITANCDSLLILIEELNKEVHHFLSENTALKTELSEQKIEVLREPTPIQWFQIIGFRVYALLTLLFIGYKVIKSKFLK